MAGFRLGGKKNPLDEKKLSRMDRVSEEVETEQGRIWLRSGDVFSEKIRCVWGDMATNKDEMHSE